MQSFKPIGWYLKEADSLITAAFNNAFESFGLTRFHWQLLRNIADNGEIYTKDYYPQVARFITPETFQAIVSSLTDRDWISVHNDTCRFTASGADVFVEIEERQKLIREKMLEGTGPEDYAHTLLFLDRVIQNLRTLPQVQP
ncbi:DNA-binding transcriptional regulator, MarR family [Chitinophaga eiseniae]|uniref:DNA-binding transcriptional regulator, MarR family n=1 Tax=Chitinophaga eiseniae TaxID=634771 RepID=A0A1T4P476_9BACT|nr:MarR family winged helix-turn-helix transcriptional regulator [Chitinophaga eiseniae]SJZ86201.1 DNA-binding transcriptional regulator, MarR family [Chitinophaga eiseniae]